MLFDLFQVRNFAKGLLRKLVLNPDSVQNCKCRVYSKALSVSVINQSGPQPQLVFALLQ
jgi:hypothetical protein